MIEAAEALFAARGIGAVSLREVGAAAGQKNNSAAQYHFGSRDGLLRAVFEHRMLPINDARQARLDEIGERPGLRPLVEALVDPLASAITAEPSSCYARFLAQVLTSDVVTDGPDGDEPFTAAYREVCARIADAIDGDVPEVVGHLRLQHAVLLLVHGLATWEHARATGRPHADAELLRTDLVDTIVGLLGAPVSTRTTDRPSPSRHLELAC
jgi:AcrR family transcriptional regulator